MNLIKQDVWVEVTFDGVNWLKQIKQVNVLTDKELDEITQKAFTDGQSSMLSVLSFKLNNQ